MARKSKKQTEKIEEKEVKKEEAAVVYDQRRDSVYENFINAVSEGLEKETESSPEEEEAAETTEKTAEAEEGIEISPEEAEEVEYIEPEEKEEEISAEVETAEKEQKTVPLAALHEEREKRKKAQAQVSELEAKVKLLETQLKTYEELAKKLDFEGPAKKTEESEEDFADPEIAKLYKKISEQEKMIQTLYQRVQMEDQKKSLEQQIEQVDKELESQGFPKFKENIAKVQSVLLEMVQQDERNRNLDVPEGWKLIYMTKVYPQIKEQEKEEALQRKKEAKSKTGLVGSTGASSQANAPAEKIWTTEDYLELRKNPLLGR